MQTDGRRTDATARALLDIIAELYKSNPATIRRAKEDPATLADIKKRMTPATLEEYTTNGATRAGLYNRGKCFLDIPKSALIIAPIMV